MGNPYKKCVCQKCVGGITWPKHAHAQSLFGAVKTDLKANRASETEEQGGERLRIRRHKKKGHTLNCLKRVDDNELETDLRLENVVANKELMLAVETEEERRARLENDAASKRLRLAMDTDEERKARLEKMVATAQLMLAMIKGVVDVGVVLFIKPILIVDNYAYHSNLMF